MENAAKKEENSPGTDSEKKPKVDILGLALLGLVSLNVAALIGLGVAVKNLWTRMADVSGEIQKLSTEAPQEEGPLGKELKPENLGLLYPLDSFLVNVASDQGAKFLQTQMELELSDPALEDEVTRKKAAVRDAIIVLLSSRSYKELRAPGGLKKLRTDMMNSLNGILSSGKVKAVYFTQFHFN